MKISCIITTCSGDPNAWQQHGGGGLYSASMYDRQRMLREQILPAAIREGFDEIWVVGRFTPELQEEFKDRVNFIFLPPARLNRIEAFRERECAARFSTGDLLIMSSDDHMVGEGFGETLRSIVDEEWDVIQPKRIHGITGEELPDGRNEPGLPDYSPWHLQCYRRWVWAMIPFTQIDTLWCDILFPETYERIGAKLVWDERLVAIDVEAQEGER